MACCCTDAGACLACGGVPAFFPLQFCCQCFPDPFAPTSPGSQIAGCWSYDPALHDTPWPAPCTIWNDGPRYMTVRTDTTCHWQCTILPLVMDLTFDGTNWIFKTSNDSGATFVVYTCAAANFDCRANHMNTFAYSTGTCSGNAPPATATLKLALTGFTACPTQICDYASMPTDLTLTLHSACGLLDGVAIAVTKGSFGFPPALGWSGSAMLGNGDTVQVTITQASAVPFGADCLVYHELLQLSNTVAGCGGQNDTNQDCTPYSCSPVHVHFPSIAITWCANGACVTPCTVGLITCNVSADLTL